MEKRRITVTQDGSPTMRNEEVGEYYHSTRGALHESLHVFLDEGLRLVMDRAEPIEVLEMGFGTGMNGLIALAEAMESGKKLRYTTIEAYPVTEEEMAELSLPERVGRPDLNDLFMAMHKAVWEEWVEIHPNFALLKWENPLEAIQLPEQAYDVVFFDAFSPNSQPELWSEAVFSKIFAAMRPGAVMTTYCAQGAMKRTLKAIGFEVERLPGPPGKREMTRARKP